MSIREATYVCPDLVCLPRDPDREARAFGAVVDAFDSVAAGVECVRPGGQVSGARPARWHGGEEGPAALNLRVRRLKKPSALVFCWHCRWSVASLEAAREGHVFLPRKPIVPGVHTAT